MHLKKRPGQTDVHTDGGRRCGGIGNHCGQLDEPNVHSLKRSSSSSSLTIKLAFFSILRGSIEVTRMVPI